MARLEVVPAFGPDGPDATQQAEALRREALVRVQVWTQSDARTGDVVLRSAGHELHNDGTWS